MGATTLRVLHTPGHALGAVCFRAPDLGCVFTGDTLFRGGPGATGWSYSDEAVINQSIRARLFVLPDDTVVRTGHGDDTTIGREAELLGPESGDRDHAGSEPTAHRQRRGRVREPASRR